MDRGRPRSPSRSSPTSTPRLEYHVDVDQHLTQHSQDHTKSPRSRSPSRSASPSRANSFAVTESTPLIPKVDPSTSRSRFFRLQFPLPPSSSSSSSSSRRSPLDSILNIATFASQRRRHSQTNTDNNEDELENTHEPLPFLSRTDTGLSSSHTSTSTTNFFFTRARYYIPSISWIPRYTLNDFQHDILAGITIASLLVPQGLSYAQALAKLPPVQGLWTAFVPLIVYTFLGTSKHLSLGPEALISMLVGSTIAEHQPVANPSTSHAFSSPLAEPVNPTVIATLLCFIVGVLTFLLGFFRLGFLDSVMSRASLRGFVTAVAVVIMIEQLITLLGINATLASPPSPDSLASPLIVLPLIPPAPTPPPAPAPPTIQPPPPTPLSHLVYVLQNLHLIHPLSLAISTFSFLFLISFRYIKRRFQRNNVIQLIPEIFLLIVMTTILSKSFEWKDMGVLILEDVEGKLYSPKIPPVFTRNLNSLLIPATLISVIGFVESIVIAKQYSSKHDYSVSPNRELVAIGVANIIGSVFGSWPCFGSMARTAVAEKSGAKTQFAGFFAGCIVLLVILYGLPLFYHLPRPVLAAIIAVAALGLVELEDVPFLIRLGAWKDLLLLLSTAFVTLAISIETGTLISIGISLLLVIQHTTLPRITVLGRAWVVQPFTGEIKAKYRPVGEDGVKKIPGVLIVRMDEGLFFGNCGMLKEKLRRIEVYGQLGVHPGVEPPISTSSTTLTGGASYSRLPNMGIDDDEPPPPPPSPTLRQSPHRPYSQQSPHVSSEEVNLPLQAIIFDFSNAQYFDASATQTFQEILSHYISRNIQVLLVRIRPNIRPFLIRSGIYYDLVGRHRIYKKIRDAVKFLERMGIVPHEEHPESGDVVVFAGFDEVAGLPPMSPKRKTKPTLGRPTSSSGNGNDDDDDENQIPTGLLSIPNQIEGYDGDYERTIQRGQSLTFKGKNKI